MRQSSDKPLSRIGKFLRANWLQTLLLVVAVASVVSLIACLEVFVGLKVNNSNLRGLLYDLSVGYLVSYLFFLLVVVIPEGIRKRRTKGWLELSYRTFKLSCIEIYLSAIGDSWDSELPESLLDSARFRDYFSERFSPDQTRWHAVHNGLYEYGVPHLITECEIFSREIQFSLIKLNLEDERVMRYLARLSASLVRLKASSPQYDDIKRLLGFLYPMHSHWSWLDGIKEVDPVAEMIARI